MTVPPMPSGSDTPPELPPEAPNNELPNWAQKQNQQRSLEQPSDADMGAFIGPKWDKVYRRKMAPFFEEASFVPTWNWSAAIAFPPAWFLYRAANRLVVQQQLPRAEEELLLRRVGGVNTLATSLFVALSMMLAAATIGG